MTDLPKKYSLLIIVIFLLIMTHFTYYSFLKPLIIQEYLGRAPEWFHNMTSFLYPRLEIEKFRFDLSFFLSKTDQILWRTTFISGLSIVFYYVYRYSYSFKAYLSSSFLDHKTDTQKSDTLIKVFFLVLLLLGLEVIFAVWDSQNLREFYKPIPIFRFFHLVFPSSTTLLIVSALFCLSCTLTIFRIKPVLFSVLSILLFLYLTGLVFSFEKTDHGYATFIYAAFLMPFFIYANIKASQKNEEKQDAWALKFMFLLIGLAYFQSGLEKILISHGEWVKPETFKAYLLLHETPAGMWVFKKDFLTRALPFAALIFQLGFISVFFKDKAKYLFIPAGILFHVGTYHLFDAGGYHSPWILVYVIFINWPRLPYGSLRSKLHQGIHTNTGIPT